MNVKAAEDPTEALQALWPRLQALAVEPVRDEADFVERRAFQSTAFCAQYAVRLLKLNPNDVIPGWDEHFVALVRENSRASNALEKSKSVEGQLERKRLEYALANQPWCSLRLMWRSGLLVLRCRSRQPNRPRRNLPSTFG
ncbi:hypothetical protein OZ411_22350 [Bradyrhizobium sp. Arg237L]|uniref:hypothetical protein n=1 Tax=Bradyrhizobium sp. Arg237L TaxID=3003352 RepID=UPI00249E4DC2|nr:hypothetical protein [Bradyrhizobium sp. Arg237L]MDI4235553.1 hypothetical protein [Bradyrhizobium sp. Arg237L]